jgi:hypothetical protein
VREKIEELQERFESLSRVQKIGLYVGSALFVAALWFFLYYDDAQTQNTVLQQNIVQYQNKIAKIDFRTINNKIAMKKKALIQERSSLANLQSEIYKMQQKLHAERFLFVTQEGITTFVDRMLDSSLKNHLRVKNVEIKDYNATYVGILKGQKEIEVTAEGNFLAMVHFLRSLEESVMLMNIERVNIETNGTKPLLQTNIRFYGVEQ